MRCLVLGLGLLLAACRAAGAPDAVIDITAWQRYEPGTLVIRPGTRVFWRNEDHLTHTATFDVARAQVPEHAAVPAGVEPFGSGDVYPGDTWSHIFEVPGVYVFFCRYHEMGGMLGVIEVTGGA